MYYFVIIDGRQSGPHTVADLQTMNITPETRVWAEGTPDWVRAADVPELQTLFRRSEPVYYAMLGSERIGPLPPADLMACGVTADTPVWTEGMPDWRKAGQVDAFASFLNPGGVPPYHRYTPGMQQPEYTTPAVQQHTNWLPWAIVGTVLALCTSCVGLIFGIIGIVKASQANDFYARGNEEMGRMANSNAQIMTIIALVLDALGLGVGALMLGTRNAFFSFMY